MAHATSGTDEQRHRRARDSPSLRVGSLRNTEHNRRQQKPKHMVSDWRLRHSAVRVKVRVDATTTVAFCAPVCERHAKEKSRAAESRVAGARCRVVALQTRIVWSRVDERVLWRDVFAGQSGDAASQCQTVARAN